MKLNRIFASATAFAVFLAMVVGGFVSKSAEARVSNMPSIGVGEFRSWFFSATAAVPYFNNGDSPNDSAVLEVTDANEPAAGSILLGFSVFAATAGSTASLYDEDLIQDISTAALSRSRYIDEIGEATQYDTIYSDWAAPRKLERGLCIITDRAPCVVTIYTT